MATNPETDATHSVYNDLEDDQWSRTGRPETPAVADVMEVPPVDSDSAAGDGERGTPEAGGTRIPVDSPAASDVYVPMETIGELETGDVVVASSAQFNGDATNDGKTSAGIGTEFGPWGREYIVVNTDSVGAPRPEATSSIRGDSWSALERPDGQTRAGVERIAAREAELKRLHERYYVPATDGGLIDEQKRDDITSRVAERAHESRAALCRMDHETRYEVPFDFYEDTLEKQQARQQAPRHRPFGAGHLTSDHRGVEAARYADTRRQATTPIAKSVPEPVRPVFDPDADVVEELTLRILAEFDQSDRFAANGEPPDAAASRLDVPISVGPRRVRRVVQRLYRQYGDRLSTLLAANRELFHTGSQPLNEITPDWWGATAFVQVERLIHAPHPSIQQVAHVSDIAPGVDETSTGSEHAKLTIWDRSGLDTHLAEGDIILASNVTPGQYRRQLTLAATSDTTITHLHRGDGPPATPNPDATSGQTSQDRDAIIWPIERMA